MNHLTPTRCLAGLLALAVTGAPAPCQRPPAPPRPAARAPEQQRPEKLTEWPELKKADRDRARASAKQLRKTKEALRSAAVEKLVAMGAGVAPVLIPLVSDRPQNVNASLFAVLDRVTDARHAALLGRESGRKSVAWRRYLTRRLAGLRDVELLPLLRKRFEDKDEDIAFYASLGALALGDDGGLDTVLKAARERWTEQRELIAATLTPARSAAVGLKVWERIGAARPTDKMAGLRLLRYLATEDQKMLLRSYLESADFAVKRAAINAARVLHGEPALEKLSSFQAINLAKQWLQKL